MTTVKKNKHAVALGRLGGRSTSEKKKAAVRLNGKLGGRPKKVVADGSRRTQPLVERQGSEDLGPVRRDVHLPGDQARRVEGSQGGTGLSDSHRVAGRLDEVAGDGGQSGRTGAGAGVLPQEEDWVEAAMTTLGVK